MATPSEKRHGSSGNLSFPHSLTFPSPLFLSLSFLPHSFFLFMICCFVPFYLAGGQLGRRRGSCGLNRYFSFIIAFCFDFFTHSIITFASSFLFRLRNRASSMPPCHRRPCGGLASLITKCTPHFYSIHFYSHSFI